MRNVAAVLGIVAFLLAPATANAAKLAGCLYSWDGANSTDWSGDNWTVVSGVCGPTTVPDDAADDALINDDGASNRLPVFSTGTITIDDLTIEANTNSLAVSLSVTGGDLNCDAVIVRADQDGSATATLSISDPDFSANAIQLDGRADATNGHAILDVNESFSISGDVSIAAGYGDIDVAASKVFTAGDDLLFVPGAFMTLTGGDASSVFDVQDDVSIDANTGTPANTQLIIGSNGWMDCDNVLLTAGQTSNADAVLNVASGGYLTAVSLTFNGGDSSSRPAVGDFDNSAAVSGDVTIQTGFADIYVSSNESLSIGGDLLVNSSAADLEFIGSSGTALIDVADDLTLDAEAGAGSAVSVTVTSGELEANDFVIKSRQSAAGNATLTLASGAFLDPVATMSFDGAASVSNGHAVGYFDDSITVGRTSSGGAGQLTFQAGHSDFSLKRGEIFRVETDTASTPDVPGIVTFASSHVVTFTATGSSGNAILEASRYVQIGGTVTTSANFEIRTY